MVKSDVRLLNTGRISSFKRRIPNSASCGFTHVPASPPHLLSPWCVFVLAFSAVY